METICFTATARVRRPQSNLVYLNDYRSRLETPGAIQKRSSDLPQIAKRPTLRRNLELLCLLLEVGTCASLLILVLMAAVRFFAP